MYEHNMFNCVNYNEQSWLMGIIKKKKAKDGYFKENAFQIIAIICNVWNGVN